MPQLSNFEFVWNLEFGILNFQPVCRGVSVVRCDQCYLSMGTTDSMDLLHDGQDGVHMFDDMGSIDLIKEVVLDGVRDLVQIMDQVHLWQLNAIHADSARTLVSTATHIEDAFFHMRMDSNIRHGITDTGHLTP